MSIFFICFFASIIGSICGIGGGIIIKPLLDFTSSLQIDTISFLSGFTVLCMSSYTVIGNMLAKENSLNDNRVVMMALGASVGGIIGKFIFKLVTSYFENNAVSMVQSIILILITIATLIYSIRRNEIITKNIKSKIICILSGLILGFLSSFLGIGGGPFNLIVLSYVFSLNTKVAAQSSLYIILFSQISSLLLSVVTGSVPNFETKMLFLMAIAGVSGGIAGRKLNKSLSDKRVNSLFSYVNIFIILICITNLIKLIK